MQYLTSCLNVRAYEIPTCDLIGQFYHNKYIFDIPILFFHNLYISATFKQFFTEFAGFEILL
jgi:hypothetical protein